MKESGQETELPQGKVKILYSSGPHIQAHFDFVEEQAKSFFNKDNPAKNIYVMEFYPPSTESGQIDFSSRARNFTSYTAAFLSLVMRGVGREPTRSEINWAMHEGFTTVSQYTDPWYLQQTLLIDRLKADGINTDIILENCPDNEQSKFGERAREASKSFRDSMDYGKRGNYRQAVKSMRRKLNLEVRDQAERDRNMSNLLANLTERGLKGKGETRIMVRMGTNHQLPYESLQTSFSDNKDVLVEQRLDGDNMWRGPETELQERLTRGEVVPDEDIGRLINSFLILSDPIILDYSQGKPNDVLQSLSEGVYEFLSDKDQARFMVEMSKSYDKTIQGALEHINLES